MPDFSNKAFIRSSLNVDSWATRCKADEGAVRSAATEV